MLQLIIFTSSLNTLVASIITRNVMSFRVVRVNSLYAPRIWTNRWTRRGFSTTRPTRIDDIAVGTPVKPEVKPYYVTTPIFYVNAAPHVGHLHSLLLTDVLARYARLRDPEREVRFATGTDEHGLKIQQVAKGLGREPGDLCDEISERFRALAKAANASNTDFIRTTDPAHKLAVQHLWKELEKNGHIYKGSHSGWYAVSDECFYTEAQIGDVVDPVSGETKKVALESGSVVEWTEEENYKFRLSSFKQSLIDWLEASPASVHPPSTRTHLLRTLQSEPLQDLSISRPASRLSWGVPVPNDPEHTIYVWVDALTNYLTVLEYPWKGEEGGETLDIEGRHGWPVDAHVVGKDIVRFHAIYWPAMLIAAGLSPPKQVIAHAHWTMNKSKMSKSKGNVADPFEAMQRYGVDAVRWYLMRVGGSLSGDADYSAGEMEKHYKLLASQVGNLASRIASPKLQKRFLKASTTHPDATSLVHPEVQELRKVFFRCRDVLEERLDTLEISRGLEEAMEIVFEANRLFTALEPWKSDTSDTDVINAMVFAHESLRLLGIALTPIMPSKTAELLDSLHVSPDKRTWEKFVWNEEAALERVVESVNSAVQVNGKKQILFPALVEDA